jgi:hypothetical protein
VAIGVGGDFRGVVQQGKGMTTLVMRRDGVGLGLFMVTVLDGEGVRAWWLGLFMTES